MNVLSHRFLLGPLVTHSLAVVAGAALGLEPEGLCASPLRDGEAFAVGRYGLAVRLAGAVGAGRAHQGNAGRADAVEFDGPAAVLVEAARVREFHRNAAALGAGVVVAELRPAVQEFGLVRWEG